ncbi:MAG: NAD(P)H-dependent oxidoreductase [Candidatus Omnitrophica bacterium]|nr:NAD(P)H-dependent oxidoreductase [Candidatus Omnitrophota bacterium]
MKAVIVFHSVCGNTYLIARAFEKALLNGGHQVVLRRVVDSDWVEKPDVAGDVLASLRAMRALPEAKPDDLLSADIILMGSPVYFGNVSAELKAFMDSTGGLWFQGKLVGKKFAAFVSAGNPDGGGDLTLAVLHTYAKYMGLLSLPLPITVLQGDNGNALGIIQYSNGKLSATLDDKTSRLIDRWSRTI